MSSFTIAIVILNFQICFGVFMVKQDNVIFSYNITNMSACRTDTDSFQGMLGIKLQDCVKECGLRKHCKALSYGRKLKICKLFFTTNEAYLSNGNCIYVTDDDITGDESPCNVCPNGQVCDTSTGECKIKECIKPAVENGEVLGNVHSTGSRVRYICKSGYRSEIKHAVCNNNGAYSAVPICKRDIRNCLELKNCNSSYTDGEYWLHVNVFGGRKVKIYCHVDENNNFGYNASTNDDDSVGTLTKYKRIRVIIESMQIQRNDTTFNYPTTPSLEYAVGWSCKCANFNDLCPPWLGYFQISTVGTGLKFSDKASWVTKGYLPGIANFSRNVDSTIISANCGGYCGWCIPKEPLHLFYNGKGVVEDSKAIHPDCL